MTVCKVHGPIRLESQSLWQCVHILYIHLYVCISTNVTWLVVAVLLVVLVVCSSNYVDL